MKLLNHTRETLERVIDRLLNPLKGEVEKPRTYRKKARKDFIAYIRKKKPKSNDPPSDRNPAQLRPVFATWPSGRNATHAPQRSHAETSSALG